MGRLVELVWGDDPPRTAEKTLQSYMTRLRKGLGSDAIERSGAAYRLALEPSAIDVTRFEQKLSDGDVDAAIGEWSGEPLAGLDAPGFAPTIGALQEQWLGASETALEQLLTSDPMAAVARLGELTERYPFREAFWAQLMTALYRSGRQADALRAYERARRLLIEELGVGPGPRLQELESLILGQDERLGGDGTNLDHMTVPTGTVTFAFCDIDESARLWALNRREMASAVATHDAMVQQISLDHGGYIFATGGDSFGVAFASASSAVTWSEALQRSIGAEQWSRSAPIRVRIGLHTGEAEERGGNYFGPPVNLAARIAEAGHGGQTLASSITASLVDTEGIRALGNFRFDGVGREITLVQLDAGQHPQLRTERAHLGNLPRRLGRLHGREDDLSNVQTALRSHSVVTLVGPGGIGKTRLALATARRDDSNAGPSWLVELAGITSSADVAQALADTLDVTVRSGRSVLDAVVSHLENRELLIVLDNCEHVIEGAAEVAQALATRCPQVTTLATSREGLGITAEQVIIVGPLDADGPASDLFVERAHAVDPTFELDTERALVEEACRRLDGIPLAVELAAARIRTVAPSELVERLDDQLQLLNVGRRQSAERHRTMRATIQWSYDLLTPLQQRLFHRLSVFVGSFDSSAAEVVASDQHLPLEAVADLLSNLVERSVVSVESGAHGRRFRLLETMRQFAAERLAHTEGNDEVVARHADFVHDEVRRVERMLTSHHEVEGATRLGELWPNVRAAIEWAIGVEDHVRARSILKPIALQMFVRRGFAEVCTWTEQLLTITPSSDEEAIAEGLLWAGLHYSMNHDRERFRQLIEEHGSPDHLFVDYAYCMAIEDPDFAAARIGPTVIAELERRGETSYARLFKVFLGAAILSSGDFASAEKVHDDLIGQLRADGPPTFLGWTLYLRGVTAAFQGQVDLAEACWDEAADLQLPPRTNSPNEILAVRAAFQDGHHAQAFQLLHAYIEDLVEGGNMAGVALVGIEFVNMMATVGRLADAGTILGHFDTTGLLTVEGPGFKDFVKEAVELVDCDIEGSQARRKAAADRLDDSESLDFMKAALNRLLGNQATTQ